jgi:CPA2 family monovalent cation:H+ antiporter-2
MQTPDSHILQQLVLLLAAALPVSILFHRLRLPAIVGFLVAGMVFGPGGAGIISDTAEVERLAEIGVVLLLFTVGLEFSLTELVRSGRQFLLGGLAQVVLTLLAAGSIGLLMGNSLPVAVLWGFLASLSSTAIVLRLYADRSELDSAHGRLATGVLLFQDIAVVPMMIVLPFLGRASAEGEPISTGSVALTLLLALGGMVLVFLLIRRTAPFLLHQAARLHNRELFFLVVVLVGLGTAWATARLGLSIGLGAFLAGLVISESEYGHHVISDVLPFRHYFASIFFISVGMLFDSRFFASRWPWLVLLAAALVAGKALIVGGVARWLGYPSRTAILAGVGLAQVGEFSFLLARQGQLYGLMGHGAFQVFLDAAILGMLATPFLMELGQRLAASRGDGPDGGEASPTCPLVGHTIIAGFGLNGRNLARTLRAVGLPYAILEVNADSIAAARAEGEPIHYGDITRAEALRKAGIECARVIVFAISDPAATRLAVSLARRLNPAIYILVRTRYALETEGLAALGADQVIPEEFETSVEIFARVLHQYRVPDNVIAQQVDLVRFEGYRMLRGFSLSSEKLGGIASLFAGSTVSTFLVRAESAAAGGTLGDLDLRRATGATVIALAREGRAIASPGPSFHLASGDILVLLGSHRELDLAARLLASTPAADGSRQEAPPPAD